MKTVSRQVRRQEERRAKKLAPDTIERTSYRYIGQRTKGLPYRRMTLRDVIPANIALGRPAIFMLKHPTRRTACAKPATRYLINLFMPNLPENMVQGMLGRHA